MKVSSDSNNFAGKANRKTAGFTESFILGVGITGGGLATSLWQQVLTGGIWEGLISILIVALGYIILDLSLSELVGIVPFAGGSFGYVRCSIGPFFGFMTGCTEMILYMFYTISTVLKIAQSITRISQTHSAYEALWGFLAYALVATVHMQGVGLFWKGMLGCTIFTFLLISLYIIGSFTVVDINEYALHDSNGFEGSSNIFDNLYSAMWLFMGICALPLMSGMVKDESETIPKAMMTSISLMVLISVVVLFCVACQYPGIGSELTLHTDYVLQYGLQHVFKVPERAVPFLLLIPTFASTVGFMFACKHQLSAMAESGLMPSIFLKKVGVNEIPIYSVLGCCLFQFGLFLVQLYRGSGVQSTFKIAAMAGCVMYIFVLSAFITFRYKYANMDRSFVSWFGVPGAILGILIFLFVLIVLFSFQTKTSSPLTASYLAFMAAMIVYYFIYIQHVQFFSKEEQGKFMKAYITNANKKKKQSKYYRYYLSVVNYVSCGYFVKKVSKKGVASSSSHSSAANSPTSNLKRSQSTSSEQSRSHHGVMIVSQFSSIFSHGKVDIEPAPLKPPAAEQASVFFKPVTEEIEPPMIADTEGAKRNELKVQTGSSKFTRSSLLRTSFNNNGNSDGGAIELNWSGKYFADTNESRKAFAILTRTFEEDEEENNETTGAVIDQNEGNLNTVVDLLTEFPEHFLAPGLFGVEVDVEQGGGASFPLSTVIENSRESIRRAEST